MRQLTTHRCSLGESPVWDPTSRCLYWIDIDEGRVWRFDPANATVEECVVGIPGIGALTIEGDGRLVLFERDGVVRVYPGSEPPRRVAGVEGTRFNDAVCDRAGRVYCGAMPAPGRHGQMWRLEAERDPVALAETLMPNGAGFSPDGATFYFTDTLRRCIYAAAFDENTGTIGAARPFARVPKGEGVPDGLAVDTDGGVWSARYDGGMVVRYDATGTETHRVRVPTSRPTGIAFAADELYIATAKVDGDPASGALFATCTGFTGVPIACSRLFG